MDKKYIYILIIMILIGCTNENVPTEEKSYVSFSNGISYDIIGNISRADVFEGTFIPKDNIVGIFAFKSIWQNEYTTNNVIIDPYWYTENITSNCNNANYRSLGISTTLQPINGQEIEFPNENNSALVFYAYHPYSESLVFDEDNDKDKGPKIAINIDPNMKTTKDYLYTESVPVIRTGKNTVVNLPFKHALSLVNFEIFTNDSKYTGNNCPQLIDITIITKENQAGWMYLKDGKIEYNLNAVSNSEIHYTLPNPFPININNESHDTKAKFLLIPAKNAIDKIILTIKNPNEENLESQIVYLQTNDNPEKNIELIRGAKHTVSIEYNVRTTIHNSVETWQPNENDYYLDLN